MKYARYIGILIFTIFRKIIGVFWFFVAVPFRRYTRNVVYNYVLQNGEYLERLSERPITIESFGYRIHPYHGTDGGYIYIRRVSKIEYYLVVFLIWGWLDDDANDDTFDYGHVQKLRSESRFLNWLLKDVKRVQYGNAFDLGDARIPSFNFFASFLWNWRNTAYNFKYWMYEVTLDEYFNKGCFYHEVSGYGFGWIPFSVKFEQGERGRLVFMEKVG